MEVLGVDSKPVSKHDTRSSKTEQGMAHHDPCIFGPAVAIKIRWRPAAFALNILRNSALVCVLLRPSPLAQTAGSLQAGAQNHRR